MKEEERVNQVKHGECFRKRDSKYQKLNIVPNSEQITCDREGNSGVWELRRNQKAR